MFTGPPLPCTGGSFRVPGGWAVKRAATQGVLRNVWIAFLCHARVCKENAKSPCQTVTSLQSMMRGLAQSLQHRDWLKSAVEHAQLSAACSYRTLSNSAIPNATGSVNNLLKIRWTCVAGPKCSSSMRQYPTHPRMHDTGIPNNWQNFNMPQSPEYAQIYE